MRKNPSTVEHLQPIPQPGNRDFLYEILLAKFIGIEYCYNIKVQIIRGTCEISENKHISF